MIVLNLINSTCHRYTFKPEKIREYVIDECENDTLNLFAGQTEFNIGEFRVDSDENMPNLSFQGDASEFLETHEKLWDTIIYDPPWNARKSKEKYEGRFYGKYQQIKELIDSRLKLNGKVISAGYEISYMGKKRGYHLEKLLIVNPGGEIRPFFISTERKQ